MKEAAATTTKNDDTAEGGTQRPLATRELTMIRPTGSRHREITNETVGVGSSLGDVIGRHTNSTIYGSREQTRTLKKRSVRGGISVTQPTI